PRARVQHADDAEAGAIHDDRYLVHVNSGGRQVVIVVAGLLVVEPADHPDVEVGVSIELHVDAPPCVVAHLRLPERGRRADRGHELDELASLEVAAGWYARR